MRGGGRTGRKALPDDEEERGPPLPIDPSDDARPSVGIPLTAHCDECTHFWPIVYLPQSAQDIALTLKGARCPVCAASAPSLKVMPCVEEKSS